jgi:hypothetical protein
MANRQSRDEENRGIPEMEGSPRDMNDPERVTGESDEEIRGIGEDADDELDDSDEMDEEEEEEEEGGV